MVSAGCTSSPGVPASRSLAHSGARTATLAAEKWLTLQARGNFALGKFLSAGTRLSDCRSMSRTDAAAPRPPTRQRCWQRTVTSRGSRLSGTPANPGLFSPSCRPARTPSWCVVAADLPGCRPALAPLGAAQPNRIWRAAALPALPQPVRGTADDSALQRRHTVPSSSSYEVPVRRGHCLCAAAHRLHCQPPCEPERVTNVPRTQRSIPHRRAHRFGR
jgi:hypothetical protein